MRHRNNSNKPIGFLILWGLLLLLFPQWVWAEDASQGGLLPRAQLQLMEERVVADGVRHLTYQGILADEKPIMVQVIEADLQNPQVKVEPVAAREGNYGKREAVSSMGARTGGIAAINGGFYNTTPPYNPTGNFMIDGELLASSPMFRISLGWFQDNSLSFGYFHPEEYKGGESAWQGIKHLITGGPLLVEEGWPVFQYPLEGYAGSLAARHPRTAIGMTPQGKMLLVVVDGRQPEVSVGLTFEELSFLMMDLGAETAMGLDGGGSSTAWINGQVINQVSEGSQRLVANGIVVKSGIVVFIDGKRIYFDVPPRLEKGRTLVPLRAFFEAMGATVEWHGETQTIVATKGDTVVELILDEKVAEVNGEELTLDVPAKLEKGRTLVPLRFIGEALGGEVLWDPAQIITINTEQEVGQ